MSRLAIVAAVMFALAPGTAFADEAMQFPDASETVPELIELYDEADLVCGTTANSADVANFVACTARSIYAQALNARDWCFGRETEANASMEWHECEADSLRFPPATLGGGF